jgi:hypothetical protein
MKVTKRSITFKLGVCVVLGWGGGGDERVGMFMSWVVEVLHEGCLPECWVESVDAILLNCVNA